MPGGPDMNLRLLPNYDNKLRIRSRMADGVVLWGFFTSQCQSDCVLPAHGGLGTTHSGSSHRLSPYK